MVASGDVHRLIRDASLYNRVYINELDMFTLPLPLKTVVWKDIKVKVYGLRFCSEKKRKEEHKRKWLNTVNWPKRVTKKTLVV